MSVRALLITSTIANVFALPQRSTSDADMHSRAPCSWTAKPPCSCPSGTYLNQSTTTATIGANAKDVFDVMGYFQQTAWFGVPAIATSGQDDTPGATRTLPDGSAGDAVEEVHAFQSNPDGSFHMEFDLKSEPPGFAGDWDTLSTQSTGQHETYVYWNIYSCFTPYNNNKAFHESAIKNATSILQSQGKIKGTNVGPTSTGD